MAFVVLARNSIISLSNNSGEFQRLTFWGNHMSTEVTQGDIAILRFLAALELIEEDLWGQYGALATNHTGFHDSLCTIDFALPRYACDSCRDEQRHARILTDFLISIGEEPVSLDAFRTL